MVRSNTVFGIFKTRNETQDAMDGLADDGFDTTEVSLLFPENASPQNLTDYESDLQIGRTINQNLEIMDDARTVHITGYGPLIAAGPAMAFLDHAEHGNKGWLAEKLINRGIPPYEAKKYEDNVGEGGFLLAIECRSYARQSAAEDILDRHGARYIAFTYDINIDDEQISRQDSQNIIMLDESHITRFF